MHPFVPQATDEEISKEKQKARSLRDTPWWRRKCASGICHYCQRKFKPTELTMDHIVPLIRGGRSVKSNLACCCKECNSRKKHMLPIEWEEYLTGMVGRG